MCDYSDTYLVVKRKIDLGVVGENDMTQKGVVFKNNAPFRTCISKISSTFIDNAEDLDTVMPMYNLLEYSGNYFMTSGKLQNYYRCDVDNINDNAADGESFNYKTKITGKAETRPVQGGND